MNLLETDDDGHPTGWQFSAKIKNAVQVKASDLDGFSNETARAYGYPSKDVMLDKVYQGFSNQQRDPTCAQSYLWKIDFDKIDPHHPDTGMTYIKPQELPVSIVLDDVYGLDLQ